MAAVDYMAFYPGTVVAQNDDLTLEITSDDNRFNQFSDVPINAGIPGVTMKLAPGAKVLFGFVGGDPSAVYVSEFGLGTVLELNLKATTIKLNNGTKGVARATDPVRVTAPTSTVLSGTIDVAHSTITLLAPLIIDGSIQTGSATVKAGD
jgi:hypothetical protein